MKTIGLLGGMSWESSVTYYQLLNTLVKEKLGGLHSARCLLHSVDFHDIEIRQASGRWEECGQILATAAHGLELAGAELLLLCTNTMHKVAPAIEAAVSVPLLHIAGVTAQAVQAQGLASVGLLGTRYTMEEDFYSGLLRQSGLTVLTPEAADRALVNDVIFQELCCGLIREPSRRAFARVTEDLARRGAQGVVLGCTEIGLLLRQEDCALPLFDTTRLHAEAAVALALAKD